MATPQECEEAGIECLMPPMVWRDIESAPKNEEVLIFDGDYIVIGILETQLNSNGFTTGQYVWHSDSMTRCDCDGNEYCGRVYLEAQPTHWMPLPSIPTKKKEN